MSRFVLLARTSRDVASTSDDRVPLRAAAANEATADALPAAAPTTSGAPRHANALPARTALWFWAVPSGDDRS
jgi:hypothetical protein